MGVKHRVFNGTVWKGADGAVDFTPVVLSTRAATMVYGTTRPDSFAWSGVETTGSTGNVFATQFGGTTVADVSPGSGNSMTLTPATYTGKRFWGQVKASANGVILRNCALAGPDPTSFPGMTAGSNPSGNNLGCVQNFGSNPPMIETYDCTIDASMWLNGGAPGGGRSAMNPYTTGWHGGNGRVYRTIITNVQDAVNFVGPSTLAPALSQEMTMKGCWIHKGSYFNNVYPPSDGQPHSDGFQFNYGRNVTIEGCFIGGTRDPVGYNTWGANVVGGPFYAYSSNTGDDYWNAAILLKQETGYTVGGDSTDYRNIVNVKIINNWLGGGSATLNIASVTARPNAFADAVITGNRFLRRQAGWGTKMRGDGQDLPGYDSSSPASAPNGWVCLRGDMWAGTMSGNTYLDDGTAIPITNGGHE